MIATPTDRPDAKAKSRRAARSPKPPAPERAKVSLYLSDRTAKLLAVTATMEGRSMSDLVESILAAHLKRWVVSDRAKSDDQATPTVSDAA